MRLYNITHYTRYFPTLDGLHQDAALEDWHWAKIWDLELKRVCSSGYQIWTSASWYYKVANNDYHGDYPHEGQNRLVYIVNPDGLVVKVYHFRD